MPSSILAGRNSVLGPAVRRRGYPRLRAGVLAVLAVFAVISLSRLVVEPVANVLWAIVIAAVSLAPAYFWASGYVGGLPILPAHAATLVLSFALPLVSGHPEIVAADADAISFASFCVVIYAAIATGLWLLILRLRKVNARETYRVLPASGGYQSMLAVLVTGSIYNVLLVNDLITFDGGLYAAVRAALLALTSIALFVVGVRLGSPEQVRGQKPIIVIVVLLFILTQATSLFLGGAIVSTVALAVGYAFGSQRVPWKSALIAIMVLGVLHAGKGEMREIYWSGNSYLSITSNLPGFFLDWFQAGLGDLSGRRGEAPQPIYERMSLMHMLLLTQNKTSGQAEALNGETYALIPKILLPRFIDPNKPSPHEATNLLNLHYGLQTTEEQESTMIGWGMIAEGFANFRVAGIAGVAAVIGLLLGLVTRVTVAAPVMSIENFIGIIVMVISVQTELTMAVLVTATMQSIASLMLLLPFCTTQRSSGLA